MLMSIYRVELLVEDPEPVFVWLAANVNEDQLVRKMAYHTVKGWFVKTVFKRQADAEAFHRYWLPESESHNVVPFS